MKLCFMGDTMWSGYATVNLGPSRVSYVSLISIVLLHLLAGKRVHTRDYFGILETGSRCYTAARHFDLKNYCRSRGTQCWVDILETDVPRAHP